MAVPFNPLRLDAPLGGFCAKVGCVMSVACAGLGQMLRMFTFNVDRLYLLWLVVVVVKPHEALVVCRGGCLLALVHCIYDFLQVEFCVKL